MPFQLDEEKLLFANLAGLTFPPVFVIAWDTFLFLRTVTHAWVFFSSKRVKRAELVYQLSTHKMRLFLQVLFLQSEHCICSICHLGVNFRFCGLHQNFQQKSCRRVRGFYTKAARIWTGCISCMTARHRTAAGSNQLKDLRKGIRCPGKK